jgi:DNA-binding MarR family transcriptional regulator
MARWRRRTASDRGSAKHAKMLDALRHFRVAIKTIRRHYQEVERQTGVSGAQLWALAHVADFPGSEVGELADALAIHPSTASNLVRRLCSLGLVTRKRAGTDRRAVQLFPTQRAANALRKAPRPLIGVLQQALLDLPAENLDALTLHLGRLIAAMRTRDSRAKAVPLSDI